MATPLYDQLKKLAAEQPLRLDMPGHHGKPALGGLWDSAVDFTENGRTGDLFGGEGDAIEAAETLWAQAFGFDSCLFLTGGSTQGICTSLSLLAAPGSSIAVDRGSHRSVFNAMALLDMTPVYLSRPWLKEGVTGPIHPDEVENLLQHNAEIKTVCITSPTYYGVLSDIPAIARVCHRFGARLMVDGAHGAHLPFMGYTGYAAADAVVMSAHKTLPAPGQTALLFANGFSLDDLRERGSLWGSSPSYVMMAALDLVRDYMEREGAEASAQTAARVENFAKEYTTLSGCGEVLDPLRLTLCCGDGFALADELRCRGIYPELADRGHVVFIFTCADGEAEFARLTAALKELQVRGDFHCPPPPEFPERVLSLREALFAPRIPMALEDSEGRISAVQVAPYPPGIPVIAPGERIGKKHLAYLKEIGYNNKMISVIG